MRISTTVSIFSFIASSNLLFGAGVVTTLVSKTSKVAVVDIEMENRSSNVISLYSKVLNQEDIAQELHVDQYTVRRDLQYLKHGANLQSK